MKKSIHSIFFKLAMAAIVIFNCGCPVGIDYPLGKPGEEKIDERLLGTWVSQDPESEMKKLAITKKDAFTYRVQVLERGEMYAVETDWYDAWVTTFKGQTFIFGKPDDQDDQKYYHYQYSFEKSKLVTHDMSLLEGGVDAVTSQEALRNEVAASVNKPDFLTSKIEYTRQ